MKHARLHGGRPAALIIGTMSADERHRVALDLALESLRKSGNLRLRVFGSSMLPTIRPGTCVLVRQTTPDQVSTGDVVLAKTPAGVQLHRVIEIRPDHTFITRGDNHRHSDPPVCAADVLAKWHGVITSEPAESLSYQRRFPAAAHAEGSVMRRLLRKLCA